MLGAHLQCSRISARYSALLHAASSAGSAWRPNSLRKSRRAPSGATGPQGVRRCQSRTSSSQLRMRRLRRRVPVRKHGAHSGTGAAASRSREHATQKRHGRLVGSPPTGLGSGSGTLSMRPAASGSRPPSWKGAARLAQLASASRTVASASSAAATFARSAAASCLSSDRSSRASRASRGPATAFTLRVPSSLSSLSIEHDTSCIAKAAHSTANASGSGRRQDSEPVLSDSSASAAAEDEGCSSVYVAATPAVRAKLAQTASVSSSRAATSARDCCG
eukprot:3839347-Prymnesium_polylepis.1